MEKQYESAYGRPIEIKTIEPFTSRDRRFSSDIDEGLSQLYRRSYDREVKITGIEPFSNRYAGEKEEDSFDQLKTNNTDTWAQQLAMTEGENIARKHIRGTHNRNNARDHFCNGQST